MCTAKVQHPTQIRVSKTSETSMQMATGQVQLTSENSNQDFQPSCTALHAAIQYMAQPI